MYCTHYVCEAQPQQQQSTFPLPFVSTSPFDVATVDVHVHMKIVVKF